MLNNFFSSSDTNGKLISRLIIYICILFLFHKVFFYEKKSSLFIEKFNYMTVNKSVEYFSDLSFGEQGLCVKFLLGNKDINSRKRELFFISIVSNPTEYYDMRSFYAYLPRTLITDNERIRLLSLMESEAIKQQNLSSLGEKQNEAYSFLLIAIKKARLINSKPKDGTL